jgi:hypothetical protein
MPSGDHAESNFHSRVDWFAEELTLFGMGIGNLQSTEKSHLSRCAIKAERVSVYNEISSVIPDNHLKSSNAPAAKLYLQTTIG